VTEVLVTYKYPEECGVAEARMMFDADARFYLADGQLVGVLELACGMRLRMGDNSIGMVTADPEFRTEHPIPPLPSEDGLWSSRVVGQVKHTAYEVIQFRWAGQQVEVTLGHVVWSEDRHWWIRAHELLAGEMVRVAGNVVAPVERPGRVKTGPVAVYGIEVEYFHNYFVGRGPDAMLVHNMECAVRPADAPEHTPLFKWETLREVGPQTLKYAEPIPGKVFEVELASGQKVNVFRADDGQMYFCHGLTFEGKAAPGGAVSPFSGKDVQTILDHHFQAVLPETVAAPRDILVWRGLDGDTPHSAVLTDPVVQAGKNQLDYASQVRTKNGRLPEETMSLEQLSALYGDTFNIYRRVR
jgi:hypothetical protein